MDRSIQTSGGNLPAFLLPEEVMRQDGTGPSMLIGSPEGGAVLLTLGINRIIEQQSLDVSVWGSADGENWDAKPLISFPQKFYCGTYSVVLDLTAHPGVRHLRAQWKMSRWGRGEQKPLFGFYVFAEAVGAGVLASAGAA